MLSKRLLIIGAGGHGKVAADCAETLGLYDQIAFLDSRFPAEKKIGDWQILGQPESATSFKNPETDFFVAIGNNLIRQQVTNGLRKNKIDVVTLIHPSSAVSRFAELSNGILVCANATINPMAKIGAGSIINTAASVDHDCQIGDYAHISVGVRLAGGVVIGNSSFIGINSCVIQGVTIGKNCMLGAGAALVDDLPDNTTAVGVPAKVIKNNDK
mgnify:CR=1 FL=1